MPGGPLFPRSAYPVSSDVFPNVHVGAGANSKHEEGLGVAASLGANAIWRLRFSAPTVLPSGTAKLRLRALANATTGDAKINAKWASVAVEEDPSSATLVAEGTSTLSWGAGDNDQYKQLLVVLDADTIVAGEEIVMDLTFETLNWTLAQVSTWSTPIVWE